MAFARVSVGLVCLVAAASAALPPGYEDELYCPKDTCLAPRKMPQGFTGPRTAFHQCVSVASSTPVGSPRAYGSQVGAGYKEKLLQDGYHTKICPASMVIKADPAHGRNEEKLHEHEDAMVKAQQHRREMGTTTPMDGEGEASRHARRAMMDKDSFAARAEELKRKNAEHAAKDAERRKQYEHDRAEHERLHAERMEDLKAKHPEHYRRMMERKAKLEGEREESLRSRIEEKKARRREGGAGDASNHLMFDAGGKGEQHGKERPLSEM